MFAERFDALMNIAEVSNSLLGRNININSSYIGRLRSGARPLPKKHEYLTDICRYLAKHIKKEYQITALQKLTGAGPGTLASAESMAAFLEHWLLEQDKDGSAAMSRLISGFSHPVYRPVNSSHTGAVSDAPLKYSNYLYGNAGKRKAVEQFFLMILQEEKPQTLLLFSDENMTWLYEDSAFAARWAELFTKVVMKGNRVKIIHSLSRDLNEMLEAVAKWVPIYMTGMIEPYCYPRIRDGLFQRTIFIAPETAAIVSSSVQQDTDGMLNMFITDKAALGALVAEYERYFALCRPLMRIFSGRDFAAFRKAADNLALAEGDSFLCCAMPPAFAMPEKLAREISAQSGNEALLTEWKLSLNLFRKKIKSDRLSLVLLDPDEALKSPEKLCSIGSDIFEDGNRGYSAEQYLEHIDRLKKLEQQYENLRLFFVKELWGDTLLYVKDGAGAIMAKTSEPETAFVISDKNMTGAFRDYIEKSVLNL